MNDSKKLDLKQLVVDRQDKGHSRSFRIHPTWWTRYVLPAVVVFAFASLFLWSARNSLLPAVDVSISPVVVSRVKSKQGGAALFQAAGWIEPRPTPVLVSAQAPGVIDRILVVEGERVTKDQPLAMLIDIDAKLALSAAIANRDLQKAEVLRDQAILAAAKQNFENPLDLRADLAEAKALLARTDTQLSDLGFALQTAKNNRDLAEANLAGKRRAGDAISGRALREADAMFFSALGKYNELVARQPRLESQRTSLRERRDAIGEKLFLKTEEKRSLAIAEATLAATQARLRQTDLAVEVAQLKLERMVVRSPIHGFVLSLESRPGQRLSGLNPHSAQGSATVATLYDPDNLQVRVDVRLEDVPQVRIGQPVSIQTVAAEVALAGEVLAVTTKADIQKNTLQVKVVIRSPPEVIKPEMLAKVTFLALPFRNDAEVRGNTPLRVFVPPSLVIKDAGQASVWLADVTQSVAVLKQIKLGPGSPGQELVEVTEGLSATDKLIVTGQQYLVNGKRIRVSSAHTGFTRGSPQHAKAVVSLKK
ncbi:MAG: HlyD family efflux transporter periplasmic adaptor subunit [Planctomycetaceae bacterium]|nr:HlyD family efflux transporter periplasmic adaptor subunit [Planctomycetaceae bacterium]